MLFRVAELRPEARRFLALAWLGAPAVELALRTAGLRRTLGWIEEHAPARSRTGAVTLEEGAWLVRSAWRRHPLLRGRCLPQSVRQYHLHRRDGTPARLVVGVRRGDAKVLEAHAWVQRPDAAEPTEPFAPILERGQVAA